MEMLSWKPAAALAQRAPPVPLLLSLGGTAVGGLQGRGGVGWVGDVILEAGWISSGSHFQPWAVAPHAEPQFPPLSSGLVTVVHTRGSWG